jgi:hypothetical protein
MALSPSSSTTNELLSSTTTIVSAVDIKAAIAKKYHQASVLHRHAMFLREEDFSRLMHHGLIDQIVKVFEDAEREKGIYQSEINDKDEDEDEEDDEDANEDEEEEYDDTAHIKKKLKTQNIATVDVSTQTGIFP